MASIRESCKKGRTYSFLEGEPGVTSQCPLRLTVKARLRRDQRKPPRRTSLPVETASEAGHVVFRLRLSGEKF